MRLEGKILRDIERNIDHAEKKHPVFAKNYEQAIVVLSEEMGECARAVLEKHPKKIKAELLDVITVAFRFLNLLEEDNVF